MAGLKSGDVITIVYGHATKTANALDSPVSQAPIRSKIKLDYVRDHQSKETTATVEDRTRVFPNTAGRLGDQPGEAPPSEFGLHVDALTPERGRRIGMEGQKGVLVT